MEPLAPQLSIEAGGKYNNLRISQSTRLKVEHAKLLYQQKSIADQIDKVKEKMKIAKVPKHVQLLQEM